mmetsp:Transcript_45309/g.113988  ORF Transcript_45309/g.113988 Transcript_45309/m.113988 type:complete len:242 (-) Transcript_45309:679-1404(-)
MAAAVSSLATPAASSLNMWPQEDTVEVMRYCDPSALTAETCRDQRIYWATMLIQAPCTTSFALNGGQCGHNGPNRLGEILLRQRQAAPRHGSGSDLSSVFRGNEDHGFEPRVLYAGGLVLQVLASVGCQSLCLGGRHVQHLVGGIPGQPLSPKGVTEAQRRGGAAKVEESIPLVLLRGEIYWQVEEVKCAFESMLDHVVQELLRRVAIRDVPKHDGCRRRGPLILGACACRLLRIDRMAIL